MQTGRQCCTERTVTPNRCLFLPLRHFPLPSLSLALLVEELPGVGAGDRLPANVVNHNLDAPAIELNQPAGCRRRQVKLEMAQRDEIGGYGRTPSTGADSVTGAVLNILFSPIQSGFIRRGRRSAWTRVERNHTGPAFDPKLRHPKKVNSRYVDAARQNSWGPTRGTPLVAG